jgi:hypothetical protein
MDERTEMDWRKKEHNRSLYAHATPLITERERESHREKTGIVGEVGKNLEILQTHRNALRHQR